MTTHTSSLKSSPLENYFNRIPGGPLIWIFFAVEMLTFSLFFIGYAWMYQAEADIYLASQNHLHPRAGTFNTLVLLSGSWCAARGVLAFRHQQRFRHWYYLCGMSGVIFLSVKVYEYSHLFTHGISLSTNMFWFFYIFLTLLHNLHVVFGIYFMFYLGKVCGAQSHQNLDTETQLKIEASAVYWHLVDIIWLFLFPLLYFCTGGLT